MIRVVMSVARALSLVGLSVVVIGIGSTAEAVPLGYQSVETDNGAIGLAYDEAGNLYRLNNGSSQLDVTLAGGGGASLQLDQSFMSIGGAAIDPLTGDLLVTDSMGFGDGLGSLYRIDTTTGATTELLSGFDTIDDVAVRSSGEIFITDATGGDAGAVYQVDRDSHAATVRATGFDFGAGLDFDSNGNLIVQTTEQLPGFVFSSAVSRLPISESGGGLSFGTIELLADGLDAGFDLTVDNNDDVFITGSGGVFELDRDGAGDFLGTASVFDPHGFSTEIAFSAGSVAFEPAAGTAAGVLTFQPEFASPTLVNVVAIPEPATAALLTLGGLLIGRRRRG